MKQRAAVLQFHYYFRFRKPDKSEDIKASLKRKLCYCDVISISSPARIHEKNKRKKRKFYTSCVIFKPYGLGIERRKKFQEIQEKRRRGMKILPFPLYFGSSKNNAKILRSLLTQTHTQREENFTIFV